MTSFPSILEVSSKIFCAAESAQTGLAEDIVVGGTLDMALECVLYFEYALAKMTAVLMSRR